MGNRLGILRVVSSFFSSGIVLFLLKNIDLKQKYILLEDTCSRPYRLENTGSRAITAVKLADKCVNVDGIAVPQVQRVVIHA